MEYEVKVDLRDFKRGMTDLAKRQIPFATAQALTATARRAAEGWQEEMASVLDRPTPFTVKSVGVRAARKTTLIARVYLRDIAAEYLKPYVDGGQHFLGQKRGLLGPRNVPLNAYGNLPKSKLATLKAKPDVFVGPVTFKSGAVVNGVWQRGIRGTRRGKMGRRTGAYGTKGKHNQVAGAATTLKLLIRFTDPQPVKQRLDFRGRTEATVRRHFAAEFDIALKAALASAR